MTKRIGWALVLVAAGCGSNDPPAGLGDGGTCDGAACGVAATCLPAPATGSILATCEASSRSCVAATAAAVAHCGDCKSGFLEVSGACQATAECAALDCAAQHRECEMSPNGHCTTCLMGFVEEAGACRAKKTCADLTCDPGLTCVDSPTGDAECRNTTNCAAGEAPRVDGTGCVTCRITCTGRPGGTGQVYTALATQADVCICETMPGFFWDDGAPGGGDIRTCDADRDGWVRETAKKYIEGNDRALRDNARCMVRTIDRFKLINDADQPPLEVPLSTPLPLFEPERNDDQGLIDDEISQGRLPRYGGRALRAEELNALTKACVTRRTREEHADFNVNAVEDVDEGHDDPLFMPTPANPLLAFSNFAYFIEIYRGWYESPVGGALHGAYVIREKSRSLSEPEPGLLLPLMQDPAEGGDYWRQCVRARDPDYRPGKAGFDFAKYQTRTSSAVFGFGHHSQFRCLRVVSQGSVAANEVTVSQARSEWSLNRCEAGTTRAPIGGGLNPADPELNCQLLTDIPDPQTSTTPPVLLGVARYIPEDDNFNQYSPAVGQRRGKQPAYTRGCVNECASFAANCPGYNPNPLANSATCTGRVDNFGVLACGCTKTAGGAGCEVGCPGDLATDPRGYLFTPANYDPIERSGYWLCGRPSTVLESSVGGGYTVSGEVPMAVTPAAPICEISTGNGCAGFELRAYGSK